MLRIDEVSLPYSALCELLQQRIINILHKSYSMNYNDITIKISSHRLKNLHYETEYAIRTQNKCPSNSSSNLFTQAPQSHAYSLRRFLHKDILCISIIDPDIFSFFCIISKDSSAVIFLILLVRLQMSKILLLM